jgi:ssDNA-binding Zn-finger/Zn-ribbon topoisomerase 1
MDLGQILIGALLVLAIIYVVGRRSRASTASVSRPTPRPRSGRQPLTRLEDVVPIPAPVGWPALPPEPAGLDGEPEARPRVELADRPYDRTTCPTCSAELDPLPKAKKRCPACSSELYVRSGPDDRRYLLTATEVTTFQDRWAADTTARYEGARVAQAAALTEWHARLRGAGLEVGRQDLDVVGESFHHAALAGIRAALHDTSPGFEVRVVALLRREPENKYDRNAIAVYVHGAQVGHLDRYDAEEYQPLLKRAGGELWVQAVLMGGRMTPVGEVGPIGVKLDDIPEPGGGR